MKRLFLASSGSHPDTITKLKKFVGGKLGDKKIVYIPTATNGKAYGRWKNTDSLKNTMSLGANIEVLELESCFYQDIFPIINKADILWFAGGMPGYLLYWMRRSELDKRLSEILDRGVVYFGASGGSQIMSKTLNCCEWYIGEPEPGAGIVPGLGYIDFEIYPHYQKNLLLEIKKHWKKGQLCLLKDGDAVVVDGEDVKILGEKNFYGKGGFK